MQMSILARSRNAEFGVFGGCQMRLRGKKSLFILAGIIISALMLTTCETPNQPEQNSQEAAATTAVDNPPDSTPAPEKAEYIKISSQEAQGMMRYNVVILDVRTQEEFDEGHVPGAVLLPYSEIREKAESVIAGKDQVILTYCRTGRRSEIASRTLIDMGYAKVYDFGGILDWTGDIGKF